MVASRWGRGARCGYSGVYTLPLPNKYVGHDNEKRRGWGGDYKKDEEYIDEKE
jgi:hypothetical protein